MNEHTEIKSYFEDVLKKIDRLTMRLFCIRADVRGLLPKKYKRRLLKIYSDTLTIDYDLKDAIRKANRYIKTKTPRPVPAGSPKSVLSSDNSFINLLTVKELLNDLPDNSLIRDNVLKAFQTIGKDADSLGAYHLILVGYVLGKQTTEEHEKTIYNDLKDRYKI